MHRFLISITLLVLAVAAGAAEKTKGNVKVGNAAPDVTAIDENGKELKLSSFKDKQGIVIFFFPKADTPG